MKDLESHEDIKFYIKLPSGFKIDTPLGKYNPVWAVVFDGDEKVYFVAETKGSNDLYDEHLGESERGKILSGRKHFDEISVKYIAPVSSFNNVITILNS